MFTVITFIRLCVHNDHLGLCSALGQCVHIYHLEFRSQLPVRAVCLQSLGLFHHVFDLELCAHCHRLELCVHSYDLELGVHIQDFGPVCSQLLPELCRRTTFVSVHTAELCNARARPRQVVEKLVPLC